ncbi:MAG: DMT family transporter [Chloroflexi bacterium]|nr:DMT family transporter [Chloroflexota bacterium]
MPITVRSGEAWALSGSLGYALNNLLSRVASIQADPLVAVVYRSLPTFFFSSAMVLRRLRTGSTWVPWSLPLLLAALGHGTLTYLIGNSFFFASLRLGGVAVAVPITSTNVLWTALLAAFFLGEPLNRRLLLGITVAVAGVILIALGRPPSVMVSRLSDWWWSIPFALITTFSWAGSGVVARYALHRGADRFSLLTVSTAWGIPALILVLVLSGQAQLLWSTALVTVVNLLVAGVLTAGALISFTHAFATRTSMASISTIGSLNPVLSVILAALLLGEVITAPIALGVAVVISGVLLVELSQPKKAPMEA